MLGLTRLVFPTIQPASVRGRRLVVFVMLNIVYQEEISYSRMLINHNKSTAIPCDETFESFDSTSSNLPRQFKLLRYENKPFRFTLVTSWLFGQLTTRPK